MSEPDSDMERSLTYEELAWTIAGIPFLVEEGPHEGQVDRRLAFETAEALGPDKVKALQAFTRLVGQFSLLEGARSLPGAVSSVKLEDLVTDRLEQVAARKTSVPLIDQIWDKSS